MKNLLVFLCFIASAGYSQRTVLVSVTKDTVCILEETPTGKPPSLDKSTLWLKADKSGQIIYNCPDQLRRKNAVSGIYLFDPDGDGLNIMEGYYDASDGGGWLMVLNYLHIAGTNPGLNVRSTDFPLLGSSALGVDESGTSFWGHASNSLLAQFDVTCLRFYGITSGHSRMLNFQTTLPNAISYAQTGNGNMAGIQNNFTALSGHTTFIPATVNRAFSNRGDFALTNFPYYQNGRDHWGVRGQGNRWELDDYGRNRHNTLHRVFIRASCDCPPKAENPQDGDRGEFWQDLSTLSNSATQTTVSVQPTYLDNATDNINFNPSFLFTNHFFEIPWAANLNPDSLTVFSVHQVDGAPFTWRTPFGSRSGGVGGYNLYAGSNNTYQFWTTSAGTGWNPLSAGALTSRAEILGIDVVAAPNGSAPKRILRNGAVAATQNGNYQKNLSVNYTIGRNDNGTSWQFNGRIAEQIVFPKILTLLEKNVVETYLALKYGVTLSHDYISPDGVLLYDLTKGYSNGIIGVGKQTKQGLYQQKSKSESDPTNGLTLELTATISSGSYLICGHNNGSLATTTLAGETSVLTRKYFAEQTGGIGTVNLQLHLSEIGASAGLPASQVKILISNDAGFTQPFILQAVSVAGGIAYFEGVPLLDSYFTFKVGP